MVQRSVDLPTRAERGLEGRCRRLVIALLRRQRAEIVEGLRDAGMLQSERRSSADECTFEQVLGLVVHADATIHAADDGEDFGLGIGLVRELVLRPVRSRQSSSPVTVNPSGVARFAIGSAPLSRPLRASLTLAAFAASRCARSRSAASRVVYRRRHPDKGQNDNSRRRDPAGVSLDKSHGSIPQRIGPGADRLVTQNALEIVCECRDRDIALGRDSS